MRVTLSFCLRTVLVWTIATLFVVGMVFTHRHYTQSVWFDYAVTTPTGEGKPTILLIDLHKGFGGGQMHFINYCRELSAAGYRIVPCASLGSPLEKRLQQERIPHYGLRTFKLTFKKVSYCLGLVHNLKNIVRAERVNLIHCNLGFEVYAAAAVSKELLLKTVLTWHNPTELPSLSMLNCCDGFIAVDKRDVAAVKQLVDDRKVALKSVMRCPPFFNYKKFLNYKPSVDKIRFFKEQFGMKLNDCPIVLDVANLLPYKNPQLLLNAVGLLINQKKIMLDLVFAGDGSLRTALARQAATLGIEKYVHFTGFTDKTADLLYYADMLVLPSARESFGIVLMEAALMKKPMIGIRGTGMENVIQGGVTGFLSTPDDVEELAGRIEFLIKNPAEAERLAKAAYQDVMQHYLPASLIDSLDDFYRTVMH